MKNHKIVKQRERVTVTSYSLSYCWNDAPSAGFSFPCTKEGYLLPLVQAGLDNFIDCITGVNDVEYEGIEEDEHSYTEPAILKCSCKRNVILDSFTNTCVNCESDYNMQGQLLADRSQWGEETGEHWSECY
jgi:uncharacterized CHY-type Zn-finger protein